MDFVSIKSNMKKIENYLKVFENLELVELEPCLSVQEFNDSTEALKNKIAKNDKETPFFQNVLNTVEYYENISSYIEQTRMSLEQNIKKAGISPDANRNLQDGLKLVKDTIDLLVIEYGNSVKNDKERWFGNRSSDRKNIRDILAELITLKEKLENAIYLDSKVVSNVVLKNFKTIYTFLSNCIKVAKNRQDELLLVEVAGISDRIMSMIEPVFRNKSLSVDGLVYYYLFYELREIKAKAIGQRLA